LQYCLHQKMLTHVASKV